MSKLAKLQEANLEKLRMLSSAGRVQLEEALAPEPAPTPEPASISLPTKAIVSEEDYVAEIETIVEELNSLPVLDHRTPDEILGHNDHGYFQVPDFAGPDFPEHGFPESRGRRAVSGSISSEVVVRPLAPLFQNCPRR